MCCCLYVVLDRMKPVSVEFFRDHVANKHSERDKAFEAEYQVRRRPSLSLQGIEILELGLWCVCVCVCVCNSECV